MTERFDVLILGYGEMGHAMEHLLGARHNLLIWEKYPEPGFTSVVLEEAVVKADFIIFCLPANPHREIVRHIEPLLKENSICLSIAKGLDEAGHTAAQIFEQVLGDRHQYAFIYGPMISEEIRADHYAFAQVGCQHKQIYASIKHLFDARKLFVEYSPGIHGISWSVILKNVYAIVFGISDELGLGDNVRGFLLVQSIHELDKIVMQMSSESGASYHLAGLGDLITTATSRGSHHHELGRLLARGDRGHISGEGIHTLDMVEKHRLFDVTCYPLFKLIHEIIKKPDIDIKMCINNYILQVYK